MDEITLNLEEICGRNIYTRADGRVLYNSIEDALNKSGRVIVQFHEKEIASESFLDEAIVEHYLRPKAHDIADRLILRSVAKPDQVLLSTILTYRKKLENKGSKKSKHKIHRRR